MGLGKGLSALISNDAMDELNNAFIADLPIEKIVPNTYQPRIAINPEALLELADSIREHGVIEPLIVTKRNDNTYELIAGERRWRAAKLAQVGKVPVVVKEASPQQMLEMAIVENVQREDLNPLEEAAAFEQLVKMFGLTHKEIGKKVGFSRAAIANKIRLLVLPEEVKKMLLEEQLSEGHARAMLGLQDLGSMITVAKIVVRDNLSVRAVEELVRRLNQGVNKHKKSTDRIIDEYTQK
jgi:ParB family transcriptional regulator, chromosome partitioning protein